MGPAIPLGITVTDLPKWKKQIHHGCSRHNYHTVTTCRSDRIAQSTKVFPTNENNDRSTTTSSLDRVQPIIPKPATDYYNINDLYTSYSTDKKHLEEELQQKQKSETEVNNVVTAADHDSNIPQKQEVSSYEYHDLITTLNNTWGVPKAALKNDYYGRRKLFDVYEKELQISIDINFTKYYHSWSDNNPKQHLLLWTSIFVCPLQVKYLRPASGIIAIHVNRHISVMSMQTTVIIVL
jgi:hypothetical protein